MAGPRVLLPGKWCAAWISAIVLSIASVAVFVPVAHADPCTDVDVVVARGTNEPGLLGDEVGDPLYGMLRDRLPVSTSAYRVDYPADYGFDVTAGSTDLVAHMAGQIAACPDQRFILVGYSQGAAVVHVALGGEPWSRGAPPLPVQFGDRVAAVLLFGDPMRVLGWTVPGGYLARTGNWCMAGDPICGAGVDWNAHTAYRADLAAAVDLAAARL